MSIFSKKTDKAAVKKSSAVRHLKESRLTNILIKQPYITEKSMDFQRESQYAFIVDSESSKPEIKKQIEKLYKVDVQKIRTVNKFNKSKYFRGIKGREGKALKKAIVFLKKGQKIDIASNR